VGRRLYVGNLAWTVTDQAQIPDPWINIYKVQELLFRFCGRRGPNVSAGYMCTLNQDLWPERYMFNEHVSGAYSPALTGLRWHPNQRLFTSDIGNYSENFIMQPIEEPSVACTVERLLIQHCTNLQHA
jgi:hypothetical protein